MQIKKIQPGFLQPIFAIMNAKNASNRNASPINTSANPFFIPSEYTSLAINA